MAALRAPGSGRLLKTLTAAPGRVLVDPNVSFTAVNAFNGGNAPPRVLETRHSECSKAATQNALVRHTRPGRARPAAADAWWPIDFEADVKRIFNIQLFISGPAVAGENQPADFACRPAQKLTVSS